jgi:type II secretory pathway predicted ATPase ExeA
MPESDSTSILVEQPAAAAAPYPFGLERAPFDDSVDDALFFPSDQHLRALEFMGQLLWTRARVGVVTASHGCGKSLLMGRMLRSLDERFIAAGVSRENLGPREFLLEVLRQYGFALEQSDKTDRRRMLERFLTHQASMGRICVLAVENAQQMHPSVLEELRCLAALEADGTRILKLLLLGQPSLNHVLESPRMSGLLGSDIMRYSLSPLSEDQTAAYVAHRLRAAGARNADFIMPYTLMSRLHQSTGGVPLKINQLCGQALACAVATEQPMVTTDTLELAIATLNWPAPSAVRRTTEPTEPAKDGEKAHGRIVVSMQGLPDRETVLEHDRVLIGRGEEADVRIDSVFVSRYHALIVRHEGQDLLLDLGSTNGLLMDSRRISRRVLKDHDVIQVGPAKMTYINPLAVPATHPDPAETICFARPGFPMAAGEDDGTGTVIAFGRLDPTAK